MSTQFQSRRSPQEGKSEGAQLRTEYISYMLYPLFRMFLWGSCGITDLATSILMHFGKLFGTSWWRVC